MCGFRVGDDVVCLQDDWHDGEGCFVEPGDPVVDGVYRVEAINKEYDGLFARLEGCPSVGGYAVDYFRKVERKSDSLSIESFLTIKPGFEEPKRTNAPAKKERV